MKKNQIFKYIFLNHDFLPILIFWYISTVHTVVWKAGFSLHQCCHYNIHRGVAGYSSSYRLYVCILLCLSVQQLENDGL